MKTLSFIVLFFALLGLSACGNRILVGKDIPAKILNFPKPNLLKFYFNYARIVK